jgi:hypothetical protein
MHCLLLAVEKEDIYKVKVYLSIERTIPTLSSFIVLGLDWRIVDVKYAMEKLSRMTLWIRFFYWPSLIFIFYISIAARPFIVGPSIVSLSNCFHRYNVHLMPSSAWSLEDICVTASSALLCRVASKLAKPARPLVSIKASTILDRFGHSVDRES